MPQQYPHDALTAGLPSVKFTRTHLALAAVFTVIGIDAYLTIYGLTQSTLVSEINPITNLFITASSIPIGIIVMHSLNALVWTVFYRTRTQWFLRLGSLYTAFMLVVTFNNLYRLQIIWF